MPAPTRGPMVEPGSVHKALNREPWDKYFCSKTKNSNNYVIYKNLGKNLNVLPITQKEVEVTCTEHDCEIAPVNRKKRNNPVSDAQFECLVAEGILLSALLWVLLLGINLWI